MPDGSVEIGRLNAAHDQLVAWMRELIRTMVDHRGMCGTDRAMNYGRRVLEEELTECEGGVLPHEMEINRATDGVTSRKVRDGVSWFNDLTSANLDKLFDIQPTPEPDLPQSIENDVVDMLEFALLQRIVDNMEKQFTAAGAGGVRGDLRSVFEQMQASGAEFTPSEDEIRDMAQRLKGRARDTINRKAAEGAQRVSVRIHDMMVETGFADTWRELVMDYHWAPYAVARRVNNHSRQRTWRGDRWVVEPQLMPHLRRVPPQNFYWTPDSSTTRNGTGCGDVFYVRRFELAAMLDRERNPLIQQNLRNCLRECDWFASARDWFRLLGNGTGVEEALEEERSAWKSAETVPCFRMSALVRTCWLREGLGLSVAGDHEQVECELWIIHNYVVFAEASDPAVMQRPYYLVPYEPVPGKMHGRSLPQVLEPQERKARAIDRAIIRSLGFSSAPITLRDLAQFANPEDVPDVVHPGANLDVRSVAGRAMPPVTFAQMQTNIPMYRQLRSDVDEAADLRSGIPRFALGQSAQLPSALRSTSMLAAMIANATKTIKEQLVGMSRAIIVPFVEELFEYLMCEADNVPEEMRVDASVQVGGIERLIQKDFLTSQLRETLQYLGGLARSGQLSQAVVDKVMYKLLSQLDVDLSDLNEDDADVVASGAAELGAAGGGATLGGGGPTAAPVLDGRSAVNVPGDAVGAVGGLTG